jgi:PAS domain S-box-containing protein
VAKEITDRKQAQEALRSQRDTLMNILDSMGDGVTIINPKYDIEYANPTLIKEFGPFDGRKCYEYLANRKSICSYCKNEEVFAGKTVHWQWYSPKNKKIYDLMDTPLTNPDGGIWKLEIFRDITEYKQAEEELRQTRDELEQRVAERTAELEKINKKLRRQIFECLHAEAALRESEHKYSSLVEDALIGVYILKDGKIEFANDKFAEIYGYEKMELIGMESLRLVHPEDRPLVEEIREKRLKGDKVPSEYEIRGVKKSGETIWVMRSYSLINFQGGPAISGMVSDMTERRMAEEALKKSDKELRILSNQLLSAEEKERKRIARELHDGIGQALSAIKFSVENSLRVLRNTIDPSEISSLETVIPLIQKTIEEVRRIVKDLRPSILDDLGILATITWFCREFQNVYAGIRIERDIDIQENDIPTPLRTVIYRILQEALNNVVKHSRANSVALGLRKTHNRIELKVQDNGTGFDLQKVFALNPSRRGFGLASMRERAELSGAEFDINSAAGEGTMIQVRWKL